MVLSVSTTLGRSLMIMKNEVPTRNPGGPQRKLPTRMKLHRQLKLFVSYLLDNSHTLEEEIQKPQGCIIVLNRT